MTHPIRVIIDLVPTTRMRPAGSNEPFMADISGIPDAPELMQSVLDQIKDALSTGQITSLIVGDYAGGNYSKIGPDGSQRQYGNATYFRDELQSLISNSAVVTPANDIVNNPAECTKTFKASARYPDDYMATTWQLNHDWKPGTVVYPHLHFEQTSAVVPNMLFGFRWQKQGKEKTTAWSLSPATGIAYPWGAFTTLNQIMTFAGITPPAGYGDVSDIVDVHLWRDYTNVSGLFGGAEVSGAVAELRNADAHIETDTDGSAQPYVKYP